MLTSNWPGRAWIRARVNFRDCIQCGNLKLASGAPGREVGRSGYEARITDRWIRRHGDEQVRHIPLESSRLRENTIR